MNKTAPKTKIVLLTQYYPPETGAPQNRLSYIARGLLERGFDVQVLTAVPNYPRGRFYPGFEGNIYRKTIQEGVPVIHCWLFATQSKNILLRLINYFSFVLSSAIIGSFVLPRIDLLLVESPPLFLSLSAWWLSKIKGARVILNISDLYPETAISLGMLKQTWLQNIFYRFEAWSYGISSLVTGQTEGIVGSIRSRFPGKKVYLLTNGIDLKNQLQVSNSPERKDGLFILGYAGILGFAQNLAAILDAAALLTDCPQIEFHLYGDGPMTETLTRQIEEQKLTNVKLMGHHSHAEVISRMGSWSIGLVPLADVPLMAGALPSKMFEVMGAGLPVLLYAPQGEASRLIERAGAGVWVKPDVPVCLADVILDLFQHQDRCHGYGQHGREYARLFYDRGKILDDFVSFLGTEFVFMNDKPVEADRIVRE